MSNCGLDLIDQLTLPLLYRLSDEICSLFLFFSCLKEETSMKDLDINFIYYLSLLFLLMQNVRQFGKCILEQVSNTRGLGCGLKFLCFNSLSLSAVYLGLRHALKLVSVNFLFQ